MRNPYAALLKLLPQRPVQVGTVLSVAGGLATVELPGGAMVQARGTASVGATVFLRDGSIEGEAPSLPLEAIEV